MAAAKTTRRRRPVASRALVALVAAAAPAVFGAAAFLRPVAAPTSAAVVRRAGAATAAPPEAKVDEDGETEAEGLLAGERYIAMNRFMVREGADAQFEQRWAQRKSSLLTLDGFRWFSLMKRVPPSGEDPKPYTDDYSYVSFTIWQNKKNFNSWRKGPAFKEAHGGGGILEFVGMIMSSFMTSKGPPKPAFWRGMLMEKTSEEKPRLVSGPGGRPDADGEAPLEPEVFVSMNRFAVAPGREQEFEQRWAQRESKLQDQPGFRFFQLMRRDQTPDDDVNYISMAAWDDRAAFDNWRQGEAFQKAHGGGAKKPEGKPQGGPMGGVLAKPPTPYFYEGKLVLESEAGA